MQAATGDLRTTCHGRTHRRHRHERSWRWWSLHGKEAYLHLIVLSKLRFTLTDVQTPQIPGLMQTAEKLGHVSMLMNWCSVCKCQQEQPVSHCTWQQGHHNVHQSRPAHAAGIRQPGRHWKRGYHRLGWVSSYLTSVSNASIIFLIWTLNISSFQWAHHKTCTVSEFLQTHKDPSKTKWKTSDLQQVRQDAIYTLASACIAEAQSESKNRRFPEINK